MNLTGSNRLLQIKLASAVISKQLQWSCTFSDVKYDFFDNNKRVVLSKSTDISGDLTKGIHPVTMVSGKDSDDGTSYLTTEIEELTVFNSDTSAAIVSILITDTSLNRSAIKFKATLPPGYQIRYDINSGFKVYDTFGSLLTLQSSSSSTNIFDVTTTTGTSTIYAATVPGLTDYSKVVMIPVKIHLTNTGSSTINFNGIGALTMRKFNDSNLEANDVISGGIYQGYINGTHFDLISITNNIGEGNV